VNARFIPIILATLASTAWADSKAIHSRILDNIGQPVEAEVHCSTLDGAPVATTKTDGSGNYLFPALPSGEHRVEVIPEPGFIPQSAGPVEYEFPYALTVAFRLSINITLKNALTVTSIHTPPSVIALGDLCLRETDPRLEICFAREIERQCRTTNQFGQYEISLAPGHYDMTVAQEDDILLRKPIEVTEGVDYFRPFGKSDLR